MHTLELTQEEYDYLQRKIAADTLTYLHLRDQKYLDDFLRPLAAKFK